ncbi:hypothetical protein [Ulvibacter antarcticus]|uniref:Uncharacterized protein n=1 Tax=Ulvibacter antarcticus TaxID=442714 RepID=A0A3L9YZN3_9FLAO|nr:hypothetical protein [Ulvibacter antarcticus]RMA64569.1 hypothetical protein BXY75_1445 [Ulvibacter antarcticus]
MKAPVVQHLIDEFDYNRYMYIPLTIIFQSCLGSIAAMLVLSKGTTLQSGIELFFSVATCMMYNAALLAQFKSKPTFWLLVVSLFVNTLLIIINLI